MIDKTDNFLNIPQILNFLGSIYQKKTDDKNLKLMIHCSILESQKILGDHRKIVAILLELMSNAIQFTPSGKIILSAELHGKETRHPLLKLTIKDTGIGISKAQQKSIFEEFNFRGKSKSDHKTLKNIDASTGWGLVIVKKLISELGGMVDIKSQPQKGTNFICLIPITFSGSG